MSATSEARHVHDSYFDLVRKLPLRPIRSDSELDRANAMVIKLSTAKPEALMNAGERDYLEALITLTRQFEQNRRGSVLPKLKPLDRLKFLMTEAHMNVSDLGRVIGSQPGASLVFHGKRSMSKVQILKIARHFGVSPALLIE